MSVNIVAVCFLSREVAHREHLRTSSYAAHMALGDFYTEIVGLADSLAEAVQGRKNVVLDIPYLAPEGKPDIVSQLQSHMDVIEGLRQKELGDDTPLQNIVDEIIGLYLSTLYKLRRFK